MDAYLKTKALRWAVVWPEHLIGPGGLLKINKQINN